jgi:hypothetical protein
VSAPEADLDLFLLSACDSDSCLAATSSQFVALMPAGTYFLVVDGYRGDEGAYDLTLRAWHGGLAAAVCDSAAVVQVATGATELEGEICDRTNYVTLADDCGQYLAFGGEMWYRLELAPRQQLDITVTDLSGNQDVDFVLWLFADCGDEPECLDHADAGAGGASETLSYHNQTGGPVAMMLGVDAIRAYTAGEGGICYDGAFKLDLSAVLAAESTSFGGLKRRFR